jgi:hypothetical protein
MPFFDPMSIVGIHSYTFNSLPEKNESDAFEKSTSLLLGR